MNQEGARALKQALRANKCLLATWVTSSDPMMLEAIAGAGFDACILDAEHGPVTASTSLMTQIISDRCQVPLLVRIPSLELSIIGAFLDNGAAGVIIPRIHTADEAAEAIRFAHYPPTGVRGFGPRRASNYLRRVDAYLAAARDTTIVIVQVETADALANLDRILDLPGLDGVLVGRNDLATELGLSRDPADPQLAAITSDILARARARGLGAAVACGASAAAAAAAHQLGANFVAAGIDVEYLARAVDAFLQDARASIESSNH